MNKTVYQYTPCKDHDYALLQWLERMRHDGELDKVIAQNSQAPSAFLQMFSQPRQLYFKLDEMGNIALAVWIEPCMGSAFLGYYAQPAYRKNREVVHFMFDMLDSIFNYGLPMVCGFVQERPTPKETAAFIKLHEKMGYTYRGFIPKFFDGTDCHIVALTAEDWKSMETPIKRRWIKHRLEGK